MSGAGTVIATSAEGAGDMPSSVAVQGGDPSRDGAHPFSEVLSLSSPDRTGSPSSSQQSPDTDDAHVQTETAGPTDPQPASPDPTSSSVERGQRRAGPPGPAILHARNASGSPSSHVRVDASEQIPPVGTAPVPNEAAAVDPDGTPVAPGPSATPVAPSVPASPMLLTAVATSTAPDGPPLSAVGTGRADDVTSPPLDPAQDGAAPATAASSATLSPDVPGVRSVPVLARDGDAPTVGMPQVPAAGGAAVRSSVDRGAAPGWTALPAGPVRLVETGSTPGAAAPAFTTAMPGNSSSVVAAAEEQPELAESPDGGGGSVGPNLDIGDLAASISRPLAGGNGDYSVQVSLHPPELGEVRALLSLQGDMLHVTLTPEHANGFEALSDAMPALHDQLAGGGVEVNVTLGQPGDSQGGAEGRRTADPAAALADGAAPVASPPVVPTTSRDPGRIDLVL